MSKQPNKDDESPQEPARKKTCIRNKAEPDLTIVVGGEEFLEYSQSIRSWSDYFDTALDSGMKEAETKHFEFPVRDPREWEWIVAVMAPLSKVKITEDKLSVALSWFDELSSRLGMEECDRVLHTVVLTPLTGVNTAAAAQTVIDSLEKSTSYSLPHSKQKCFEVIHEIIEGHSQCLSSDVLQRIVSLVKDDRDCRSELLASFQTHLPESLSADQQELLIQQGLLHHIIYAQMCALFFQGESDNAQACNSRFVELVNDTAYHYTSDFKRQLKSDPVVGHLFD